MEAVGLIRTTLHHLSESFHRCLLCTVEATFCQEGAHHHLKGAAPGQVIVFYWTGGCFASTCTLGNKMCKVRVDTSVKSDHEEQQVRTRIVV